MLSLQFSMNISSKPTKMELYIYTCIIISMNIGSLVHRQYSQPEAEPKGLLSSVTSWVYEIAN